MSLDEQVQRAIEEEIKRVSVAVKTKLDELSEEGVRRALTATRTLDALWDECLLTSTVPTVDDVCKGLYAAERIGEKHIPDTTFHVSLLGQFPAPTGNEKLDEALKDAHNDLTVSSTPGLRGPKTAEGYFVYGLPLIPAGSALPVGTLIITSKRQLEHAEKIIIEYYGQELDTRIRALPPIPLPPKEERLREEREVPSGEVRMFGISLTQEEYQVWRKNYITLTRGAEKRLSNEPTYVIPLRQGFTDPHGEKLWRIVEELEYLPGIARALPKETRARSFSELVKTLSEKSGKREQTERIYGALLRYMNDTPEAAEYTSATARENPAAFHAANIGEALALIALYKTLDDKRPGFRQSDEAQKIDQLLPEYGSAGAFLRATKIITTKEEGLTLKPNNALLGDLPGMHHYLSSVR